MCPSGKQLPCSLYVLFYFFIPRKVRNNRKLRPGRMGVGKEIRENGHIVYESGLLGLSHDGRIVSDVYCI